MANTQEYSTIVRLNATEAKNQLDQLTKKVQDLENARNKALADGDNKLAKTLGKELKAASAELKSYETNVKSTIDTLNNLSDATVGEIEKAIRAIKKEMKAVSSPEEYKALNTHLESLKGRLSDIKGEVADTKPFVDKIADGFNKWQGAVLAAAGAVTGLSMTIKAAVQAYADMEEAQADVQKYTGMSKEGVELLNEELKKMDTRTAREDLNALAGAAGRLGITSQEGVLEFVDAADKIGVALGDDLGEGAVDKVGKLAMAFGEDEKKGLRGAMLATGSAMNELAANSSANAGYLVEFSSRLAGVGSTANMTQADIMGLGAVLDENLLQSEMSATAISQVIVEMEKDAGKFAQVAGKSMGEFSELVKNDVNQALVEFLEGLNKLGDAEAVTKKLDEMSLDGARMTSVLMALGNKTQDIIRLQDLANKAYAEGTSVLNEYNTMNNTVQAKLDKAKKRFQEVTIELGKKLLPVVSYTISGFSLLVKALSNTIEFFSKNIVAIVSITAAIATYTVAVNAAAIATRVHYAALVLVDDIIPKVIAKTKALWIAMISNPISAIVAAIAALVAGMVTYISTSEKASDAMSKEKKAAQDAAAAQEHLKKVRQDAISSIENEKTRIEQLDRVLHNNNLSYDMRKQALEELKKVVPEYHAQLTREGQLINDNNAAIATYIDNLIKEATIKAFADDLAKMNKALGETDVRLKKIGGSIDAVKRQQDKLRATGKDTSINPYTGDLMNSPEMSHQNRSMQIHLERQAKEQAKRAALQAQKDVTQAALDAALQNSGNISALISGSSGGGSSSGRSGGRSGGRTGGGTSKDTSADKAEKERRARMQRELDDLKKLYFEEEQLQEQDFYNGILKEEEYLDNVAELRQKHLAERIVIMQNNGAKEDEINQAKTDLEEECLKDVTAYYKRQMKEREEEAKRLKEEQDKLAKEQQKKDEDLEKNKSELFKKFLQDDVEATKKAYRDMAKELLVFGKITQEEYLAILDEIEKMGEEAKDVSTNGLDPMTAGIFETSNAIADLSQKLQDGTAGWEDYAAVAMAAVNTIMAGVSSLGEYYRAEADVQVKREEEKYDKMIAAAGKNKKKTEKLEKQKQQAIAKIKNEANEKEMKIQIAQAIAGGAQAAINAYASGSKVNVWLGPIAAAAAVAATAIQIATIKKQAEAQRETGYYSGGFTGGRNYRREAGVVHEGEFVANHEAVNNRSIYPALSLIDQAQRNHTVGSLTADDISRSLGQGSYYPMAAEQNNAELQGSLAMVNETVAALREEISDGIVAIVTIDGEKGVAKNLDRYNKLKNNAR